MSSVSRLERTVRPLRTWKPQTLTRNSCAGPWNCRNSISLLNPVAPFEITSFDITRIYPVTPRKKQVLLTFVDHFSKYAAIFAVPDQSASTCARIYASQIVTRHGSGWKLITDQGAAFKSSFFNETRKVMGIRRSRTSSYHPMSNGHAERKHRTLHTALSHYLNQSHTARD